MKSIKAAATAIIVMLAIFWTGFQWLYHNAKRDKDQL